LKSLRNIGIHVEIFVTLSGNKLMLFTEKNINFVICKERTNKARDEQQEIHFHSFIGQKEKGPPLCKIAVHGGGASMDPTPHTCVMWH
jgi:hypothetical protein